MSQDHPPCDLMISVTNVGSSTSRTESTGIKIASSCATVKRRASPSFEDREEGLSSKRLKSADEGNGNEDEELHSRMDAEQIVDELEQELQCGCCSGIVYRPVIVSPCQHFFCGSCCLLWIKNGGSNCPACRGISGAVTPSRHIQRMVDLLLKFAPHKARPDRERLQADEIYTNGSMRIPLPREPSPEPTIHQNTELARPCPHCDPNNPWGWRCPQPIPDPAIDLEHAWHVEDGSPPGHAYCGNCENLMAVPAPTTTKCDLCQVSFCGIGVQGRCVATPLLSQHPHGMSEIGDLIMSSEVYECFDSNTVEVEIMIDYLSAQRLTPRHIYREIIVHLQSQPRGFAPLIELELFSDVHGVAAGIDPDPSAPRNRICRVCATEVLLWGLRDWWTRERQKGFLEEHIMSRKDCPEGSGCQKQKDLAHAREFNHIIASRDMFHEGQTEEQIGLQTSAHSAGHTVQQPTCSDGVTGESAPNNGISHVQDGYRVASEVAMETSNPVGRLLSDVTISQ